MGGLCRHDGGTFSSLEDIMLGNDRVSTEVSPAGAGPLGSVVSVTGSQASIRIGGTCRSDCADVGGGTVGKFLVILTKHSRIVGVVTKITAESPLDGKQSGYSIGRLDLLGEIRKDQ